MNELLSIAVIYLGTMALGYFLKQFKIADEAMKKSISKLILNVTLPALLIGTFTQVEVDFWFIICILLGILVNVYMVVVACFLSRKKAPEYKGMYPINGAGFNMGNLAIPFLGNFYPAGLPYLCMFDVGDSFLTLGTTYGIGKARMKSGEAFDVKGQLLYVLKSLVTTPAFDVYIIMTVVSLAHIQLPMLLLEFADFIGRGNSALAMLLIGMSLDFSMGREELLEALKLLGSRYFCGITSALIIYFLLPAPLVMRQILTASMFTATPAAALIFTMKLEVPTKVAGALAPLSALTMIPSMCLVIWLMG